LAGHEKSSAPLVLGLLDFDDFAAGIVAAVWANAMGKAHLTAIRAGDEVLGIQSVVGAPSIAACFGVFMLGYRWHFTDPQFHMREPAAGQAGHYSSPGGAVKVDKSRQGGWMEMPREISIAGG
jgi:hypothetical protein